MAMNPMQRKANMYLIIGVLVTLLITGSIIGFLVFQLVNINKEREAERKALKEVYMLSEDVSSGDSVSEELFTTQKIASSAIPTNAITMDEFYDEEGNPKDNLVAKINLTKGTIVTEDMIVESENATTDDMRLQEYNMLRLMTQIQTGDVIDIRFRLPSGEDYIVISKKKVEIPAVSGTESETTLWLNMTEAEILVMSNAIIEAYQLEGSMLYVTKYVEPGMQQAATTTFVPKASTQNLMLADPNILQEAKNALFTLYNRNIAIRQGTLDPLINSYDPDDAQDNIASGVEEEIDRAADERQSYLESLGE